MSARLPQVTFIYDRYKKASPEKRASVELRVTYNYKQRYISTGVMLYPNQWRKGKVVNCADAVQVEQVLDNLLIEVKQIILDMQQSGNIDIANIKNKLKRNKQEELSFNDFCYQRTEIRKYGKSLSRQKRYKYFFSFLNKWGKIQKFSDITAENIILFDSCLKEKDISTYTKWHNYHEFLNSFIQDAIDAGHIQKNPYKGLNIDKGINNAGLQKYLSPEEFNKLKRAKMPTESLEKVKDLFIFQTYTCLSYGDLQSFDASRVQKIKGMLVYIGARHKTGKPFTIPMLPSALKVLSKYNNKLPIISNVKYNLYLKSVAQAAGIDKPLCTHWARHTGATLLLNEGIDIKIVSKICGHSSIRITEQIYAKLLDETVVDAVQKVSKKLK